MPAIHLRDCTTGFEVIENFEAVRARLNALWSPPRELAAELAALGAHIIGCAT